MLNIKMLPHCGFKTLQEFTNNEKFCHKNLSYIHGVNVLNITYAFHQSALLSYPGRYFAGREAPFAQASVRIEIVIYI